MLQADMLQADTRATPCSQPLYAGPRRSVAHGIGSATFTCALYSSMMKKVIVTSSSAIAEGPRDALSLLKPRQLLRNCTKNHI